MKGKISRSPSYLVRNPYTYCFRMCVPKDLQQYIGRKELRYSLKTGYLGVAKNKARLLAGFYQYCFGKLREEIRVKKLSDKDIKHLSVAMCRSLFDKFEKARVIGGKNLEDKLPTMLSLTTFMIEPLKRSLVTSDYSGVKSVLRDLLTKEDYEIDEESFEFKKLCRELIKNSIKWAEIETRRNVGDYSDDRDALFPVPSKSTKSQSPASQLEGLSITLDNLIKEYSSENVRAGNWSERTQIEYKSIFNNIIRLFGNMSVNKIERQTVQHLKQVLLVLPKNYFKATKKYADVPFSKFLDKEPKEKLSAKTVNKYLDNIKALFRFAVDNGYMETNFAEGLRIRIKGKAYEERDIFSNKDLTALFHSKEYSDDTFDKPWKFWLPLLGLYTGCRLEELCQLNIKDIKQVSDIWVLDIKEDVQSDKKTKTESSNRFVPLHPIIIKDLHFLGYVNQLKKKGKNRLFPELKKQSGRYGHYPSRWFKDYKENCGIVAPSNKKVFHSFRHNLQDNLKQQLIQESLVDEMVGHVVEGLSFGRYGKQYRIPVLYKEAVLKLNYGIDLSHLRNSKYVIKE